MSASALMPTMSTAAHSPSACRVGTSIVGGSAWASARLLWRKKPGTENRPLAIAVYTWFSCSSSRVRVIVRRRHIAASGAPTTSHGTSSDRSPSHGSLSGGA
jgi:hypothetical protein